VVKFNALLRNGALNGATSSITAMASAMPIRKLSAWTRCRTFDHRANAIRADERISGSGRFRSLRASMRLQMKIGEIF